MTFKTWSDDRQEYKYCNWFKHNVKKLLFITKNVESGLEPGTTEQRK